MFQFILSTQDGEVLGVYSDGQAREAREDAEEICSITREPLLLHRTLEEECCLMVGDVISGRPYQTIRPTKVNKKVDAR